MDICWRFLNAGSDIGYAPAAVVWHHRRSTVSHISGNRSATGMPKPCCTSNIPTASTRSATRLGRRDLRRRGARPRLAPPVIYHGRFGDELFPAIYRQTRVGSAPT